MRTRIGNAAFEPGKTDRTRRGFTMLELLVVLVVAGVLVAITGKQLASAFSGNSRSSATRVVATMFFRARAIAIQRSSQTSLVRSGNTIKIMGDSSGTQVQLAPTVDLNQRYGVTLTAISTPSGRSDLSFDPRGLITGTTTSLKIVVTKGTKADTVCASGLGGTKMRGC